MNKFKSFIAWLSGVCCIAAAIWLLMTSGQQHTPDITTLVMAVVLFNAGLFGHYQASVYFLKK